MTEIDRVPLKNLWDRYGVGKTKFYETLDLLRVERIKVGNQAFLTRTGQERLDRYFSLPEEGRSRFVRELSELTQEDESELVSYTPDVVGQWVERVAIALRPPDPFSHYEHLERFAQNGWLIRSRDLSELIGRKLRGSEVNWGGFRLERVAARWWKVSKRVE